MSTIVPSRWKITARPLTSPTVPPAPFTDVTS